MKIIRNIVVALSMYSRIPMPVFEWKEDDTKYAIGFLWIVGVLIGAAEYGLLCIENLLSVPLVVETLMWIIVPLVITGGFHVDGFMDVKDAFSSYKSKEEKLAILKDPHIGAFSVISLVIYGALYMAATYIVIGAKDLKMIGTACVGFVLMRSLGGYLSVKLKLSKKDGMLHAETKSADGVTKLLLVVTMVISICFMAYLNFVAAECIACAVTLFIIYFKNKCYKEFGGINGDTIGYFITEGELIVMCVLALLTLVKV